MVLPVDEFTDDGIGISTSKRVLSVVEMRKANGRLLIGMGVLAMAGPAADASQTQQWTHASVDASTNRQTNGPITSDSLSELPSRTRSPLEFIQASSNTGARTLTTAAILAGGLLIAGFGLLIRSSNRRRRQSEQALRISEARFRGLFENAVSGVAIHKIILDENGKPVDYVFLQANPAFETQTGLRVSDVLGKRASEVLPAIAQESWVDVYGKVALSGIPINFECFSESLGRHYHINAYQVGQGCFATVFRDITESKGAETALRESESRMRAITDSAQDAILMMDPAGRVSHWNPAAERILGYTRKEALGRNLHELIAPQRFHEAHEAAFPEFKRSGRGAAIGQTLELHACRKDGEEITVALSLSAVMIGHEWHAVGILRDITEQKRVEKAARETSAALRAANQELEAQKEQLKAQGAELTGLNEELQQANVSLAKAMERASEMAVQAEAANSAKSEFLANMSHEIRTPMTAILGYSDLVAESLSCCGVCPMHAGCETQTANQQHIQAIRRNGEHLLQLINDVLDLSKIEAEKMTTDPVVCSPHQVVTEAASLIRVRAKSKGLPFHIEFAGPVPETIRTDPLRLRQILINLLGNAIKFTQTGEVRLRVSLATGDGEPRMQFDVIDTGIGMTEEQAKRILEPFVQADTSTSRRFGGTGLGLVISRRLAQLLGGDVCLVASRPGQGSRFRATVAAGALDGIPMVEIDPTADVPGPVKPPPPSAGNAALKDVHILLAEDGPDNQRLIAHILQTAGAAVTVIENGQLAVEAALSARDNGRPFDVILMDMQMSVLDGYDATRQLRANEYQGPIVALTAHAMAEDRQKCLDAGCDDYASKPIDRSALFETIQKHVDRVRAASPVG